MIVIGVCVRMSSLSSIDLSRRFFDVFFADEAKVHRDVSTGYRTSMSNSVGVGVGADPGVDGAGVV